MKRYQTINKQLFIDNRKRFTAQLKPKSLAIFHSNEVMPRNGDACYEFKQNSDMFWLTGIDQEECALVIFPDCPIEAYREALFVKRTNEQIAVWDGHKYTQAEATQASGIKNVFWMDEFDNLMRAVIHMADTIYLNTNENDRASNTAPYKDLSFALQMRERFPLHHYERAAPIMQRLRSVKSTMEVEYMKHAIEISNKMFHRVLKFVKPGVKEYEIEAEVIHEFVRNGAAGHSFTPIVASGKNACVLHYIDNADVCKDGELLLLDTGTDYGNYISDMTRTFPVNGRFTPRQKDVYNAVLRVMREAKKMLKPGVLLMEYHAEVCKQMEKELVDLKLITMDDIKNQNPALPAFKKYYMHGTSHFLGLDVHDVGMRYEPMQAGMMFSCEPGIYIPEEGIGIRLENEILITNDGCIDLMEHIPIEADHIEDLMHS
ncbi:X-Pro aminopeptidase [Bacteroidetes bacterium UKL13-3]|jgi:Xaa-Pro aminopeptidase|nr:X-Pro aminopeptidase [Bacteroidetes bacterium UKL13-3]HCP93193.1 X-Pro aminopeptidase [Bacteroidota bacterium]